MFKKETEGDNIETIIGPSVQVEGNFVANGDIVIEGIVAGSIKTEKNLRIGQGAKIYADIFASNALIAGEVQGNIKIKESLELTNTARVFGDIRTNVLNVGVGAILQGKCCAGEEKKSKLEKIDDLQKVERQKNKGEKEKEETVNEKVR